MESAGWCNFLRCLDSALLAWSWWWCLGGAGAGDREERLVWRCCGHKPDHLAVQGYQAETWGGGGREGAIHNDKHINRVAFVGLVGDATPVS